MRNPENELYDQASELVQAAAGIRRAAGDPHAARAVPAALACIEDALGNLALACDAFAQPDLSAALRDARRASGAARAACANGVPSPAQLQGGPHGRQRRRPPAWGSR